MTVKIAFISYSHDSDAHSERVLELSEKLRGHGIETRLDRYVNGTPNEGWPRWMMNQLEDSHFVLVVCTATYYSRFRGKEVSGKGKGVDWESALITQEMYDRRSATMKFVPVLFESSDEQYIPEPLRAFTHYTLTNERVYQSLYDFLLGQAGVEPSALGALKTKFRATGKPLLFGQTTAENQTKVDVSRIIKFAPAEIIGRGSETQLLEDAWSRVVSGESTRPRVLTFVALGGEGKTSLVAKWVADLAYRDWPGCDVAYAWSFYSQGTREHAGSSSDLFLQDALSFFGDTEMAVSAQGAYEKGRRLAQIIGTRRALLILDGVEPLQYSPTSPLAGELKDQGISSLLVALAGNSHGLCVVTTRYEIADVRAYRNTTAPVYKLARLAMTAGVALMKRLGVTTGSDEDFEQLVEDVDGHALTLQILGGFLSRAFDGDIRRRDQVDFQKADKLIQGGHAFRAMAAYEKWMQDGSDEARRELAALRLMGLFDRPATKNCISVLTSAPSISGLTELLVGLSEEDWNLSVTALEKAGLISVSHDRVVALATLDAHPLVREYFGNQLSQNQPTVWRAAHNRLYHYLCKSTKDMKAEPTLEDLQPLYQAVVHGCNANLHQETLDNTYHKRIFRERGAYATKKLGALGSDIGAIACFFESPWSRVSTNLRQADQAWVLGTAALFLHILGRLGEALHAMQAGTRAWHELKDWRNLAISLSNLCDLKLTLGDISGGLVDAEESIVFADRSGDRNWIVGVRAAFGNALNQAGRRAEALAFFREAEHLQQKYANESSMLYSVQGFHYCDLLLAEVERDAWRNYMAFSDCSRHTEVLEAISDRAKRTLQMEQGRLLDTALDNLTLSRVDLYGTALALADQSGRTIDFTKIEIAVSGLRRAGMQHEIPRGLLARAWLRAIGGKHLGNDGAKSDLDEALEVARRGPMSLIVADILLYRARLFYRVVPYPWSLSPEGATRGPKDDLAEARQIIESRGYWRRREELGDAEKALRA